MSKKDCAFQYAVASTSFNDPIIEDTDLITYEEAVKLWNKYLPDFIKRLQNEENPEMAIWVDMKDNSNYHKDLHHIDSRDGLIVEDGKLYEVTKIEVGEL